MLLERSSQCFGVDMPGPPMECFSGCSAYEMTAMLNNQMRPMSGSVSQKNSSRLLLQNNLPRRYSIQGDGSPTYISPNTTNVNINNIALQSRFHCINNVQKTPLRNVFSAPISQVNAHHPLPQLPVVRRQDSLQSASLESMDTPPAVEPARYKTELCRPFEETGQCRYGSKCQFAHGMQELRSLNRHPKYKTEFCRTFHTTGFCSYGQRCNFIHNDEERRGSSASMAIPQNCQKPSALHIDTPLTISSNESPAGSMSSGSPSQSSHYLNDDVFSSARMSPTPSFGSDGASVASTYSPPSSPKHDYIADQLSSPLDLGFNLALFSKLRL